MTRMQLFVDVDGFLKTDVGFEDTGYNSRVEKIRFSEKTHYYIVRPYISEFINIIRKHGDVNICTLASRRYAEFFLGKFEIGDRIERIFSRENLDNIPPVMSYCIFDNDDEAANLKMSMIEKRGFAFQRWKILVSTYDGRGNDSSLLRAAEQYIAKVEV